MTDFIKTWEMFVLVSWVPNFLVFLFFIVTNSRYKTWIRFNDWFNDAYTFKEALPRIILIILYAPILLWPLCWTLMLIFNL